MLIPRGAESYRLLVEVFTEGKVAAMACDTIYGLVGAAPQTENQIRLIKGRGETKPFLRLIPSFSWLETCGVRVPDTPLLSLWPGPFTFVMNLKAGGTAAFRIPEDTRLCSLLRDAEVSVFSTSVNRAGEKPLNDPEEIERVFGEKLFLVEDAGRMEKSRPSTVVDLTASPFRVLRKGAGTVPEELLFR